jgi:tetratricopeptide (TPR) repeat protein
MTNLNKYEYDVFISYNQNDGSWAEQLATRLEAELWQGTKLKVFFAPWDIKPGESILRRLESALPQSRKVCLVMSPDSDDSEWVRMERYITNHIDITERQARLIPLYRRPCEIPPFLQHINRIDFQDDVKFEDGYRVLLATIKDQPLPRGQPKAVSAVYARIPRPPIVGFVARRDSDGYEIVQRLKDELAPQKSQLIALNGPGGVGKTTLAAEAARELSEVFGGRIVWIGADGRNNFAVSTLLNEIGTQLGHAELRTLPAEAKAEQVQLLIAGTSTLIVVDNFETIAPAEQDHCVDFLLHRTTCPVLITTREKIAAAINIKISVMLPDEADDFVQRLIEQANYPSAFAQLDRDRIMRTSERNPLLLQWVMGQIDLAQEANTVLDELAQGIGDAAERVFERSYRLTQLGDDGRAVLLALSLFAPNASRPALAEVADFGKDLKRLNEAVKHLASLWLTKPAMSGRRLAVEGLTRKLAKARLAKAVMANQFRRRFVNYFLSYAEAYGQPTSEDYYALESEKNNIISAMDAAIDLEDWGSVQAFAYALALPVSGMLSVHGYWDEAVRLNTEALKAAFQSSSERAVADFTHNLAVMRGNRGELIEARRLYNDSLAIERKLGDRRGIAISLHQLGNLAQKHGELDEARRLYHESLEIKKSLGNQSGIAATLHELGRLAQSQGAADEAQALFNESLAIDRKLGNQNGIAVTLLELGRLAQSQGEPNEARRFYSESFVRNKKLGHQSGIAVTLHELGRLAQSQGEVEEARRFYSESLARNRRLGHQSGIAVTLHELGRLAQGQGELEEAHRFYNESLAITRKLDDQKRIGNSLHQLGQLAEEEDNRADALQLFSEALAIFEKLKSPYAEIARRDLERVKSKSS